jgi:uncharacterized protein (UPF0332 family)
MNSAFADEVSAYLQRAEQSINAAQQLASAGYGDIAVSRAYHAAFYASTALLLSEGLELSKHSAVISSVHQHFVKPGKLDKEQGKTLNWLFELRGVADYGGMEHVSAEEVQRAIEISGKFIRTIESLLRPTDGRG